MEVQALWGFIGQKGPVRAGEKIEVSQEYGHALIGKGLVKEVSKPAPKSNKSAAPAEDK